VPREDLDRARREIDAPQLLEFAVAVGDQQDAAPVRREIGVADARGIRTLAHRRDLRGGEVHDEQVRFVRGDEIADE
jgi:hypothetical protein